MNASAACKKLEEFFTPGFAGFISGLLLVTLLALLGLYIAENTWVQSIGLGPLTIAMVIGLLAGNSLFPPYAHRFTQGIVFSKSTLLRLGIILYGFRVSVQQVYELGLSGIAIGLSIVVLTLTIALFLGKKLFKIDNETCLLIGAGSAICGAAAILATESITKAKAEKVSVAVATVVIFGTISMFVYPQLFPYLEMSPNEYGIYVGSTVHEVAQVVAAANAIGDQSTETAVVEKMFRVMLLVPFLFLLLIVGKKTEANKQKTGVQNVTVPWFAVLFVLVIAINSTWPISVELTATVIKIDDFILAMAMTALGLSTNLKSLRHVGLKPFGLAALLFLFLSLGGYLINLSLTKLL
ncbi:YeiH family protein [Neopusillimonas maritima]|uniref:YeiH family protein n=1 Tax=Neopusillimonas maritima TaxID=2026239 RepID=UPI0013156605|nr:YeiH family protein [Neopusillimonas maritima]